MGDIVLSAVRGRFLEELLNRSEERIRLFHVWNVSASL